jgi:hypothetical protein
MKYLVLSAADAITLDRAFQSLAQPSQSVETTRHLGHVEHPTRDEQALKLPSGVTLYVQPDADVANFKALVADWLGDPAADEVEAILDSKRGEHVVVKDFIEASTEVASAVDGQIKTRSELETDGWFPEPTLN